MTQLALKYLNFAHSNEKIHAKYKVELKESQILRMVAKAYLENVPIRVQDLIDLRIIASPATIHASMKRLISKGMIGVKECKKDGRVKYLYPTTKSLKLYCEIAQLM